MSMLLAFRFLQGGMGSTGASVVGGTLADIWITSERGLKMAMFSFICFFGNSEWLSCVRRRRLAKHPNGDPGVAPLAMSWVEARPDLEWRWIQWMQVIMFGVCLPFIMSIPETREGVILRRQAARKRKSAEATDSGTYMARSEANKPKLVELIKASSLRPLCKTASFPDARGLTSRRASIHGAHRPILQSLGRPRLGRVLCPYR